MNVHALSNFREPLLQLFSIEHAFNTRGFVAFIFENTLSLNIVERLFMHWLIVPLNRNFYSVGDPCSLEVL